ncbi:glycine cleavage system H protein-like [Patiria miniata]|uniref:Glycine cleavage system H protein n=1 Tax=Patiria miniata TaxID=46514 RepID=A0A914B1Y8_PATMI|nr:glycine cleavage system H protein-like [Patiria miniata]
MSCPRLLQQSASLCSRVCRAAVLTTRPNFTKVGLALARQQLLPFCRQGQTPREFSCTSAVNADRLFSKDHEWLLPDDAKKTATIGISDHAQEALGDIVFIELPEVGAKFAQSDSFGVVESVKAASDLYALIDGEITEVNDALSQTPELVNSDPLGAGWMIKMTIANPAQLNDLMTEDAYQDFLSETKEE